MSEYNTKYKEGFQFPVMMVIKEIDGDDEEDTSNYRIVGVDGCLDESYWTDLEGLENAMASCNPEMIKQRKLDKIAALKAEIEKLEGEI